MDKKKRTYDALRGLWDATRKPTVFSRESQLESFEDIVIASLVRARSPQDFWGRIAYAYQVDHIDTELTDLIEDCYSDIRARSRYLLLCLRGAVLYETRHN